MKRATDEWLRGYAAALADVERQYRYSDTVVQILRSNGLTIETLRAAGAEAFDLSAIERAHRGN